MTYKTSLEAFNAIICPVNAKYGAPMGRSDKNNPNRPIKKGDMWYSGINPNAERVFKRQVSLNSGGYDKGGAYWGLGSPLYVLYTRSLSLIRFERD